MNIELLRFSWIKKMKIERNSNYSCLVSLTVGNMVKQIIEHMQKKCVINRTFELSQLEINR